MAFKGYRRSIKLEFDYDEVKAGVPNVSKQMAVLNAEFRKSSAEAAASGKEIDKLGTKYDFLNNKIKIQEQQVENYRKKLETATNAKGNNTKAIQNNTASLEIAEAKLAQTRAELDRVTQELEKQKTTLGKTSDEWKSLSEKTTRIGKGMTTTLTLPIMAAAAASFKLGADMEDAMGKIETVFKGSERQVEAWADTSLKAFGLAKGTALQMAGDYGGLANSMGVASYTSLEMAKNLTELTMDLVTFQNKRADVVKTGLTAIFTGETESLKGLGVVMTQANLQQFAYTQGIRKKISEMTEAEKVQLRYNYVMDRTAQAHGNYQKESEKATAQMELFKQGVKELGESFYEHILPIFLPVLTGINNMIEKFAGLSDGTKKFIVVAGGIVAVVGPTLLILGKVFSAISNISSGMKAAKGAIEVVSKAGKSFKGLLGETQFLGFAKWAIVIAGVALAIAALVTAINYLIGRGKDMNQFSKNMSDMVDGVGSSVKGASIRGYAVGTKYHPGGLAMVGEEGPELVDLPRGAKVYTNSETNDMLSSGDTFVLQVNMNEVDEVYKLTKVFNQFRQTKRAGVVSG